MDRSNLISQTEKQFIIDGIDMDIRNDGRRRLDMRDYTMETGLFPYCSGSSRVKCRIEGTEVTVGIKVEVDDSLLDDEVADEDQLDNDKGRIICNVQWYVL